MPDQPNSTTSPDKPGYTTTEFWQTVLTSAITLLVAIVSVFRPGFNLNSMTAIVPALGTVAAAASAIIYTHSRTTLKQAMMQATQPAPPPPPDAAPVANGTATPVTA